MSPKTCLTCTHVAECGSTNIPCTRYERQARAVEGDDLNKLNHGDAIVYYQPDGWGSHWARSATFVKYSGKESARINLGTEERTVRLRHIHIASPAPCSGPGLNQNPGA